MPRPLPIHPPARPPARPPTHQAAPQRQVELSRLLAGAKGPLGVALEHNQGLQGVQSTWPCFGPSHAVLSSLWAAGAAGPVGAGARLEPLVGGEAGAVWGRPAASDLLTAESQPCLALCMAIPHMPAGRFQPAAGCTCSAPVYKGMPSTLSLSGPASPTSSQEVPQALPPDLGDSDVGRLLAAPCSCAVCPKDARGRQAGLGRRPRHELVNGAKVGVGHCQVIVCRCGPAQVKGCGRAGQGAGGLQRAGWGGAAGGRWRELGLG